MASTANIVINDGTIAQTFSPIKRVGTKLTFLNKVGAIAQAFKSLVLSHDLWSVRRPTTKVEIGFDFPLPRTDSFGVVSATNVARLRCVATLPSVMTSAEKVEFGTYAKNILARAEVQAYLTTDDPMM